MPPRSNEMLPRSNEMPPRSNEMLPRMIEMLPRSNEMLYTLFIRKLIKPNSFESHLLLKKLHPFKNNTYLCRAIFKTGMKKESLFVFSILLVYTFFCVSISCAQTVWDTTKVCKKAQPVFDLSSLADGQDLQSDSHGDQDLDLVPCEDDFDDELSVDFLAIELPLKEFKKPEKRILKYLVNTRFLEDVTPPPPNSIS